MAVPVKERTLEETPTWAVAVVCFVLVVISIFIKHAIHRIGQWLKKKHKRALYESLEQIKEELMLLGFISLLLTVLQGYISNICVSKSIGATWHPCKKDSQADLSNNAHKLLEFPDYNVNSRRILAVGGSDKCAMKGNVPFVSSYGIHQLHIFIFMLAVFHVCYCIITLAFGRIKMNKWKTWENETKTLEYQYTHDPHRFRFTRDTSFGRRHLNCWSRSTISLWIVCFFRQFFGSVNKVDYLTLRHGFIMAHLAPGSQTKFDFQKYISRSLEEDFKVAVGISPAMWFFAVLFLMSNTHGIFSYLWLPFIPLIIILLVGAKLQVIITEMGLRIPKRGSVVKGSPVVQPDDELFWFSRPHLILFLIHFVLFQNAFQLAFFAWSTFEFGLQSCFHKKLEDIIIRISMGVIIQVLCSYVTLPLFALVTQMGSTMRPTIFNERVVGALKNWHMTAKKRIKQNRHSDSTTTMSSRTVTPTYGMSPVHLLHNFRNMESFNTSPRSITSNVEIECLDLTLSTFNNGGGNEDIQLHELTEIKEERQISDPSSSKIAHHHINKGLSDFSFGN